jgi:two-component system, OmpR family, response regulator
MEPAAGALSGPRSVLPPAEPRPLFAPLVLVASLTVDERHPLAQTLAAAGYELVVHTRAAAAARAAAYVMPDVVLVDDELFDASGADFIATLRSDASRLASVPVIALVDASDEAASAARYAAGADLCLPKTARVADLAAQVGALVRLSLRFRAGATSPTRSAATRGSLASGDLSQISIASLLTLLEIEARSGALEVRSSAGTARLTIVRGRFVQALLDDDLVDPVTAARVLITWTEGEFTFDAAPHGGRNTGAPPIGETLEAAIALTSLPKLPKI